MAKWSGQWSRESVTPAEREAVRSWLVDQLGGGTMDAPLVRVWPPLFRDGKFCQVYRRTNWIIADESVWLGGGTRPDTEVPLQDRVAVMAVLAGLFGVAGDEQVQTALAGAVGRAMVGAFEGMTDGLIAASAPVEKIAFGLAGAAAWMDGQWVRATGEPVEVDETGSGWTVVEVENRDVVVVGGADRVTPARMTQSQAERNTEFARWARERYGFSVTRAEDGRPVVAWAAHQDQVQMARRPEVGPTTSGPVEVMADTRGVWGYGPALVAGGVAATAGETQRVEEV